MVLHAEYCGVDGGGEDKCGTSGCSGDGGSDVFCLSLYSCRGYIFLPCLLFPGFPLYFISVCLARLFNFFFFCIYSLLHLSQFLSCLNHLTLKKKKILFFNLVFITLKLSSLLYILFTVSYIFLFLQHLNPHNVLVIEKNPNSMSGLTYRKI